LPDDAIKDTKGQPDDDGDLPALELRPEMRIDYGAMRDPARELLRDLARAQPRTPDVPREAAPEPLLDIAAEAPRDMPREAPRDLAREPLRDLARERMREAPSEPREPIREPGREPPRDIAREVPREVPRDIPREPFREAAREMPREAPRESEPPRFVPPRAPPRPVAQPIPPPPIQPSPPPAAQPAPPLPAAAQRMALRSPWLTSLTLVVALLGAVGAALLGWQLYLLQEHMAALQASISQSGQVADAATRLSDAATQANEIANQALATTARPWIGVDTVEAGSIQPNQPLSIEVRVRNSGRTPSTDVQGLFLVYISPIDNPPALLSDQCSSCVRSVVLPNGNVTYKLSVKDSVMTPDEVQRIKDGKDTMWIVGRLDYHDGEGESHTSKSCLSYRTSGIASFTACNDGNSAN
jgi:hypothetical protein